MHRLRSFAVVLVLGIPSLAGAQPAKKQDPVAVFLQQDKYTYCDVKILAALWKQSVGDAKATVGLKLQAKNEKLLDRALGDARAHVVKKGGRCTFAEAGFTYDDAKKLAQVWKQTEADAKLMAEAKILGGAEKYVRELARGPSSGGSKDPTSTFLAQDKYTYCDVKLLSALWKVKLDEAKATIGLKLQTGNETYLTSELTKARTKPKARCSYADAGLSYSDVEKIAKMWKLSVAQAKVKIGQKVTANGSEFLREMLGGPGTESEADLRAFLTQDKYTYCDAAMIGAMWKQSVQEGKTFIGAKLRMNSAASVDRVLADARAKVKPAPAGCEATTTKPAPKPPVKPVAPPPTKAPVKTPAKAPPPPTKQ